MMDIPFKKNIFLWPAHSNEEVMPPHKEPQSLEQLSCQVLLAVLYHLTIRHDHDVTQSGQWSMLSGQNHGDEDDNIIGQLDILLISFIYSTYREGLSPNLRSWPSKPGQLNIWSIVIDIKSW